MIGSGLNDAVWSCNKHCQALPLPPTSTES